MGGYHHPVHTSPTSSHFTDINLLGVDFCNVYDVSLWYDHVDGRVKLYFGTKWEVVKKSKL